MLFLCREFRISKEEFDQIKLGTYKYVEIDEFKKPVVEDDEEG